MSTTTTAATGGSGLFENPVERVFVFGGQIIDQELAEVAHGLHAFDRPRDRSEWVGCPVRAIRQVLAKSVDGRLLTERLLFQDGLDSFDPVTSSDGMPARLQVRDAAIVCVGYCGALRMEELSRARVEHIEPVGGLYRLRLPVAKTTRTMPDQAVLLDRRDDALDPIAALDRWLAVRGDDDGPLFVNLHHRAPGRKAAGNHLPAGDIRGIIQDLATREGLPPRVSGYSLRRYLADPNDLASVSMQLRHASIDMTVRYVEDLRLGDLAAEDILSPTRVLAGAGGQPVQRNDVGFDPTSLSDLVELAGPLSGARATRSPATRAIHDSHWATRASWADEQGWDPLPATAERLALFVAARADQGLKPNSLRAQLHHLVERQGAAGYATSGLSALATEVLDAYSRTETTATRRAPVLPVDALATMAMTAGGSSSAIGLRDRLLVCVGYCGAMRPDDLARARLEDVETTPWGAVLRLRGSKDNPFGTATETVVLIRRDDALDPISAIDDLA